MDIYRNLTAGGWSVRGKGGEVVCHANHLLAYDVQWVVQPGGRARARREGQRNVHAFARTNDIVVLDCDPETGKCGEVTYNPFAFDTFVWADTEEPVFESAVVLFCKDKVFAQRA